MELNGRANSVGQILDPWMFQDPSACPPSEVRQIALTPEVLAEEARKVAEREARRAAENPWLARVKPSLSMENLRAAKPKPLPEGRRADPPREERAFVFPAGRSPKPRKPRCAARQCPACGHPLAPSNRVGVCRACYGLSRRKVPAPSPPPIARKPKRLGRRAAAGVRTWFEESELDTLWYGLSVADKWALLEGVLGE
jgi:ribosomal protein S14